MIKLLQISVNRSGAAMDLLSKMALEMHADLLLISEPNKKIVSTRQYLVDKAQ